MPRAKGRPSPQEKVKSDEAANSKTGDITETHNCSGQDGHRDEYIRSLDVDAPARYSRSGMVTVLIGNAGDQFHIHKDLVCRHSEYIKACFRTEFRESLTLSVSLPEETPKYFELFLSCLYDGELCNPKNGMPDLELKTSGFVDLYLMADRILAEDFTNAIMDAFRAYLLKQNLYPQLNHLRNLPSHVDGFQQMRRFIFECNAYWFRRANEHYVGELNKMAKLEREWVLGSAETMTDFMKAIFDAISRHTPNPTTLKGCHFHRHERTSCSPASKKRKHAVSQDRD